MKQIFPCCLAKKKKKSATEANDCNYCGIRETECHPPFFLPLFPSTIAPNFPDKSALGLLIHRRLPPRAGLRDIMETLEESRWSRLSGPVRLAP